MCLHVLALFIHTFFVMVHQVIISGSMKYPGKTFFTLRSYSRVTLYTSITVSQVIMIYLFVQFSKPAKLDDESDDEDDMI